MALFSFSFMEWFIVIPSGIYEALLWNKICFINREIVKVFIFVPPTGYYPFSLKRINFRTGYKVL